MDLYSIGAGLCTPGCLTHYYLLLDHAGLPGLGNRLNAASLRWKSLFAGAREHTAEELGPVLILAGTDERLLISKKFSEWIYDSGRYQSAIVMLSSSLDFDSLYLKLVERLDVNLAGNLQAMLRYYDPRVLEALVITLNDVQKRWLLGIGIQWWCVNRMGDTIELEIDFDTKQIDIDGMSLSQTQEDELLRASEVDLVLELLRKNFPELAREFLPAELYHEAMKAVSASRVRGATEVVCAACEAAENLIAKKVLI